MWHIKVITIRASGILLFSLFFSLQIVAQKKPLDLDATKDWPVICREDISNDGKTVNYCISSPSAPTKFIAQAVNGSWKWESVDVTNCKYTDNGKFLILKNTRDSIFRLNCETGEKSFVETGSKFLINKNAPNMVMVFDSGGEKGKLTIVDLLSNARTEIKNVVESLVCSDGSSILIVNHLSTSEVYQLRLINLRTKAILDLYVGRKPTKLVFDITGDKLAFFVGSLANNLTEHEIWLWQRFQGKAKKIAANDHVDLQQGSKISNSKLFFSGDGTKVFFNTYQIKNRPKTVTQINVNVWNYKDLESQDVQRDKYQKELTGKAELLSVLNIRTNCILQLQQRGDNGIVDISEAGGYVLIESNKSGSPADFYWNILSRPNIFLVNTDDGNRRLIIERYPGFGGGNQSLRISPKQKYVIWYDRIKDNWFTYCLSTKKFNNISKNILEPFYINSGCSTTRPYGMAGWDQDDEFALIYGQYGLWKVDLDDLEKPVNITRGVGKLNHICFRLALQKEYGENLFAARSLKDTFLITGTNQVTKVSEFYLASMSRKGVFVRIGTGKHNHANGVNFMRYGSGIRSVVESNLLIKARDCNVYIYRQMDTDKYPNIYLTRDFNVFQPVSDLHPEKKYNWIRSELLEWKSLDGRNLQGILYKPENFDLTKKYPLIVYYYEKNSDFLHSYIDHTLSNGDLNIPWFVSNGYLVVVPDIEYTEGNPGRSALNSVVSVAKSLSKKSWVNPKRIGITGHSFGGFETNYIVSHTNMFAAASTAAGPSNLISDYGEFSGGLPSYWFWENGQFGMGNTMWGDTQSYVDNSPILFANKVNTPILIMHSRDDGLVPWQQGIKWYFALKRCEKRAWMLEYSGEPHTLETESNQLDYTVRLGQFFDHYLKGKPAPIWMTTGVSVSGKGLVDDLALDPGVKP